MTLSNAQHTQLMQIYERRQQENREGLRRRRQRVYQAIPAIKCIDEQIADLSIQKAKRLLDGDQNALSSLHEEISHRLNKKMELLEEYKFPINYLQEDYHCNLCKDRGYVKGIPCSCFLKEKIALLYNLSSLKEVVKYENFSTFSLQYYSPNLIDSISGRSARESAQIALSTCQQFVHNFSTTKDNLLLFGTTGTGKTFLTHCIAKELMDASYSVLYCSASQLFDRIARSTFRDKEDLAEEDPLYHCDLLIIDDLGTEFSNAFTNSAFFQCLNQRNLEKKSTIISTNLSLSDIKELYSERIFSRISSQYTLLRLTGDDIRIQKKLLNSGGKQHASS